MFSKTAENRKNPRQKYEVARKPGHMVTLLLLLTKTSCYRAYIFLLFYKLLTKLRSMKQIYHGYTTKHLQSFT